MQKTDEIMLTIAIIVLLLTVILAVLLWQMKKRRENAEMTERLSQRGINIPETIHLDREI